MVFTVSSTKIPILADYNLHGHIHSGKFATIRESNHGSGVCNGHYALYYEPKSSILSAITGVWKISSIAGGFKNHKLHLSRLFCSNHTCYCINIVSVTSASRYHMGYQSRSSMYTYGLIPRNFTELAEAVPIGAYPQQHEFGKVSRYHHNRRHELSHWYPGSGVVLDCIDS